MEPTAPSYEVSNRFHALPPRPNSLMQPENTRLPAQTDQLAPEIPSVLELYQRF
jgi:hypothetical protein